MFQKLDEVEKRYDEITKKISDPEVIAQQSQWQTFMKEHAEIEPVVLKYREYKKAKQAIEDAKEMLKDPEMKELAEIEIEENKEKFLEFKKRYTYFSPYYDFLICSLKWISYPSLIDETSYVTCSDNDNEKRLRTLSLIRNFDYEEMYKKNSKYTMMLLNSNDENIGLENEFTKVFEVFFDEYGTYLSNDVTKFHEVTAMIILNGICASNGEVIKDLYLYRKDRTNLYEDYLMERLGFLIVGNYRGNMQIMYNPNLVSPSQRKLIYEYSDYGYTKRECDFEYDKDGSKEFATNYRRSRL